MPSPESRPMPAELLAYSRPRHSAAAAEALINQQKAAKAAEGAPAPVAPAITRRAVPAVRRG